MKISTAKQVGTIVKRGRISCGLTQTALAERVGVSRRLVNDLENGSAPNIGLGRLIAILDVLNLPISIGDEPMSEKTPDYLKAFEDDMVAAGNAAWELFNNGEIDHAK